MKVESFAQGTDNWGHLLYNKKGEAIAVDPLDASRYLSLLSQKKLNLKGILLTHYHADHIEGVPGLLEKHKIPVYGPIHQEKKIPFVTHEVGDDEFQIESFSFNSRFLPGHSKHHCVYESKEKSFVFVGDLLFHLGCGRVMDCEPQALFQSLQELKDFPIQSEVFVGHDYSEKNLRFAKEINPRYYSTLNIEDLDKNTTLEMELWWNPFLRASSFDEWWELRQLRNTFQ